MLNKKTHIDIKNKCLQGSSSVYMHGFEENNSSQEESELCQSWFDTNSCPKCGRNMRLIGERYQYDDPYEYTWYECLRCGCTVENV